MSETLQDIPATETEDDIICRHRAERKALQGQITQLKHQVPKGDKKRKKQATEQAARLEQELDERHEQELTKFHQTQSAVVAATSAVNELKLNGVEDVQTSTEQKPPEQRVSKAQRRRDKAAAAAREREERIAAQELKNLEGPRFLEQQAIAARLENRGLCLLEIPADGNCLYAALSHQLLQRDHKKSVEEIRSLVADQMLSHQDDYQPYLTNDSGDTLSTEAFNEYCETLRSSNAWGGHVEIQAASQCLGHSVEVIQAEGEPQKLGDAADPLVITYHRHRYGLGEHYNSTTPRT